jgi:hypothetical protein
MIAGGKQNADTAVLLFYERGHHLQEEMTKVLKTVSSGKDLEPNLMELNLSKLTLTSLSSV